MPFVNLLHSAGDIQFHYLHQALIFKIGHWRIVECYMTIFSDTHAA